MDTRALIRLFMESAVRSAGYWFVRGRLIPLPINMTHSNSVMDPEFSSKYFGVDQNTLEDRHQSMLDGDGDLHARLTDEIWEKVVSVDPIRMRFSRGGGTLSLTLPDGNLRKWIRTAQDAIINAGITKDDVKLFWVDQWTDNRGRISSYKYEEFMGL